MAINRIDILLRADDRATNQIKKFESQTTKTSKIVQKNFTEIAIKAAAVVLAVRQLARVSSAFVEAASKVQQLETRLTVLTGTIEKGNELFRSMAELAGRVPFTYDEIMDSAVNLRAVVRGGNEEVEKLMPIILDLAATTGLGVQETTSQMIRMYSAGAGAADLFRERGVLAMLGFQAGVSVSAEETMDRVIEAWQDGQSRFRGATDKLAETWQGRVSMMQDAWFKFKAAVGESAIESSILTGGVSIITDALNDMTSQIEKAKESGKSLASVFYEAVTPVGQLKRFLEESFDEQAAIDEYVQKIYQVAEGMGLLKTETQEVTISLREQLEAWNEIQYKSQDFFAETSVQAVRLKDEYKKMATEMEQGFSSSLSSFIQGTKTANELFKDFGQTIIGVIADYVAKQIIAATIGKALQSVATAFAIGQAKILEEAWRPAAVFASVATAGGAAAAGAAGLVGAYASSKAITFGGEPQGLAEGGIVPATPGGRIFRIGEGGKDEAVIPLDKAGGNLGFGDINIYISNPQIGDNVSSFAEELGFEIERVTKTARSF